MNLISDLKNTLDMEIIYQDGRILKEDFMDLLIGGKINIYLMI